MMPIMMFIGNPLCGGRHPRHGYLAIRQTITVGDGLQAFIQYVRSLTQPITQLAVNISNVLQQTAARRERVFEFLEEAGEVAETESPIKPSTRLAASSSNSGRSLWL